MIPDMKPLLTHRHSVPRRAAQTFRRPVDYFHGHPGFCRRKNVLHRLSVDGIRPYLGYAEPLPAVDPRNVSGSTCCRNTVRVWRPRFVRAQPRGPAGPMSAAYDVLTERYGGFGSPDALPPTIQAASGWWALLYKTSQIENGPRSDSGHRWPDRCAARCKPVPVPARSSKSTLM